VELGVERVDALERELAPAGQRERLVELAPLEQRLEDAQRRGPGPDAHRGAGLGERLGDGETESAVVGDARHHGALAAKIDGQHGREVYQPSERRGAKWPARSWSAIVQCIPYWPGGLTSPKNTPVRTSATRYATSTCHQRDLWIVPSDVASATQKTEKASPSETPSTMGSAPAGISGCVPIATAQTTTSAAAAGPPPALRLLP